MTLAWTAVIALSAAGCAETGRYGGSQYRHRFARAAAEAAQCFARNAEEHSSALVARVSPAGRGSYDVVVAVKNGAPYAQARIDPATAGSTGTIVFNVQSSEGNARLRDALVAGC